MIIKLYDYDYSKVTSAQQLLKVLEEIKELEAAGSNLDQVAEESFDVIQALVGYLVTLGIDIEGANEKHLAKLYARHARGGSDND